MAQLSILTFRPGETLLHRLDTRYKLISFLALGLTVLYAKHGGLFVLTLFALSLLGVSRLFSLELCLQLRHLFFFLVFVWLARFLFTPGTPLVSFYFLTFTREGAADGALICYRMALIVLLSLLYSNTTRPSLTREAVHRILKPFPFVPGKQIADMMGLMTRFIPVILDRISETTEAQRSRAVENRKNPIYRIKNLVVPLLQGLFADAHALSEAMEARCYAQDQVLVPLPLDKAGWIGLAAVLFLCLLCLMP